MKSADCGSAYRRSYPDGNPGCAAASMSVMSRLSNAKESMPGASLFVLIKVSSASMS
ncbi:hypothetical protein D3C83_77390 [compost metagenome]